MEKIKTYFIKLWDALWAKTDLDEKVLETLDDVEIFLEERKSNVQFVWNKFRKTAYVFISIGFVAGVLFGGAFL